MLAPGAQLDRFILVEVAGEGVQGAVWKAIDPKRPWELLALKLVRIPHGGPGDVATEVARMRREAQALRELDHPSLVRCHGLFEDYHNDLLGLVLDWIDGQSLAITAHDPRMTVEHRQWVLRHMAHSIAYLHTSGLVHRDLKFTNVLTNRFFWEAPSVASNVKLVDLGVVAPFGNPNPLTELGNIVGTAPYVAPEMVEARQAGGHVATPAGDVFAFGVLGWCLLTGEHPTGLPANASMWEYYQFYKSAVESHNPFPARRVEGLWGSVLRRCLSLRAEDRLANASQIVQALGSATGGTVRPPLASTHLLPAPPPLATPNEAPWVPLSSPPPPFPPLPPLPPPPARSPSPSAHPSEPPSYRRLSISPSSPPRGHVFSTPAPPRSWGTLPWLFAGFGGALAVGLVLLASFPKLWHPAPRSAPPSTPLADVSARPVASATPAPPSSVLAANTSRTSPGAAAALCPSPCCGGEACAPAPQNTTPYATAATGCTPGDVHCPVCPSGRGCVAQACASRLKSSDKWRIRLGDIIPKPSRYKETRPFLERYPHGEICLRISGTKPWTCTRASAVPNGLETRLEVTTDDLTHGGLDLLIRDGSLTPPRHVGGRLLLRVPGGEPDSTALCQGVRLGKIRGPVESVLIYLDDPETR